MARLKLLVGGGEGLPKHENPLTLAYAGSVFLPEGAWTISTPAGFGMLWQITGERKYAELAWQALERGWAGVRDRDGAARYGFLSVAIDGELRAGPVLGMVALAYDLCYDAWTEQRRSKVRDWLLNHEFERRGMQGGKEKSSKQPLSLEQMMAKPNRPPSSNHHGAIYGGCGLAVLALMGDTGVAPDKTTFWRQRLTDELSKALTKGFGDHGFHSEGQGPSDVAKSMLPLWIQASMVAGGEDWITPRPNAQWLPLLYVLEMSKDIKGRGFYPIRHELFGIVYGDNTLRAKPGLTCLFPSGFGILPERRQQALLWSYEHCFADGCDNNYDTLNYPHKAVLALVNWPIGKQPINPAEVMEPVAIDRTHGYTVMRTGWKDINDGIVTFLAGRGPQSYRFDWDTVNRPMKFIGGGRQVDLGWNFTGDDPVELRWRPDLDGQSAVRFANGFAAGVARGEAAGVNTVLARLNSGADGNRGGAAGEIYDQEIKLADTKVAICSISDSGMHPKAQVDGDSIVFGGMRIQICDGLPVFSAAGQAGLGDMQIDGYADKGLKRFVEPDPAQLVLPKDPVYALDFETDQIITDGERMFLKSTAPEPGPATELFNATFVPGVRGTALRGGSRGAYGHCPPHLEMIDGSFTYSYWIKLEHPVDGYGLNVMVGYGKSRQCLRSGWHPGPKWNVGTGQDIDFGNEAGHWYHHVLVVDKDKGFQTAWFDGKPVSTQSFSPGLRGKQPFFLFTYGKSRNIVHPSHGNGSGRYIDELKFFDRPLSNGEVVALHRDGRNAMQQAAGKALPPIAGIVASQRKALPGQVVTLSGERSADVRGGALSYAWDMGDGATATTAEVEHNWKQPGEYKVTLTVTSQDGLRASAETVLQIGNQPPVPVIRVAGDDWPQAGAPIKAGASFSLDAVASRDPEGANLSVQWQPAPTSSDGMRATWSGLPAGAHRILAQVKDAQGSSATLAFPLTVADVDGCLPATPVDQLVPGLVARTGITKARKTYLREAMYDLRRGLLDLEPGERFGPEVWCTVHDLHWNRVARTINSEFTEWFGWLKVPADGAYTFHMDGVRAAALWLDGYVVCKVQNMFNYDKANAAGTKVVLREGYHRMRVLHYGSTDDGLPNHHLFLDLAWEGPKLSKRQIGAGDVYRSLLPTEALALTGTATVGDELLEVMRQAPTGQVEEITPQVKILPGEGQRTVRLHVNAGPDERVSWMLGNGLHLVGATVEGLYNAGRYVATATWTRPNGSLAVAMAPITIPTEGKRRIGVKLLAMDWPTFHAFEPAGLFTQRNWNRWVAAQDGVITLIDADGKPTGAKLTAVPDARKGRWLPWPAHSGGDGRLFFGAAANTGCAITGIPYENYDVIVYWADLRTYKDRLETINMTCNGQSKTLHWDMSKPTYRLDSGYVNGENQPGNYLRWNNLSGTDLNLKVALSQQMLRKPQGAVSAIQIIER